jgi:hypothetical protein
MEILPDIKYTQLLKIVKNLSPGKLRQLKAVIDKQSKSDGSDADLLTLLLNGPVATKKQLETIELNRKDINKRRKR